jgi:hypothetical protein
MEQATIQIFPLTELRQRANLAPAAVKSIKVYAGHGNTRDLVLDIRRDETGQFPQSLFDYFERKHEGPFKAIFTPTKEIIYLDSGGTSPYQSIFNGLFPGNDTRMNTNVRDLVNDVLRLERENAQLKEELQEKTEELERLSTLGGKLEHVFTNIVMNQIIPIFAGSGSNTQPMQGVPQQQQQQYTMEEWTTIQVEVPGDIAQSAQNAAEVIYMAFGADTLIAMAKKLQSNPTLVTTLKGFL